MTIDFELLDDMIEKTDIEQLLTSEVVDLFNGDIDYTRYERADPDPSLRSPVRDVSKNDVVDSVYMNVVESPEMDKYQEYLQTNFGHDVMLKATDYVHQKIEEKVLDIIDKVVENVRYEWNE